MDLESKYCYFYHSWDFVPYYHKISKYSYSFSIKHQHAYVIVVEHGGCNTSHSKRVEQAFYTKYTGK